MKKNKIDEIDINRTLLYILKDITVIEDFIYKHCTLLYNNCVLCHLKELLEELIEISENYNTVVNDIRDNVRDIVNELELKDDYKSLIDILMDLYMDMMSNIDKDGIDDNPTADYIGYNVYPLLFMIKDALYGRLKNEIKKEIENGV